VYAINEALLGALLISVRDVNCPLRRADCVITTSLPRSPLTATQDIIELNSLRYDVCLFHSIGSVAKLGFLHLYYWYTNSREVFMGFTFSFWISEVIDICS